MGVVSPSAYDQLDDVEDPGCGARILAFLSVIMVVFLFPFSLLASIKVKLTGGMKFKSFFLKHHSWNLKLSLIQQQSSFLLFNFMIFIDMHVFIQLTGMSRQKNGHTY